MEATGTSDSRRRSLSTSHSKPPWPLHAVSLRLGGSLVVAELARGCPRLHLILPLSWSVRPFHKTKTRAKQKAGEGTELISKFHINLRSSWVPVRAVSTSHPIFLCLSSSQWGRCRLCEDSKSSVCPSDGSPEGPASPFTGRGREFCHSSCRLSIPSEPGVERALPTVLPS